MPIPFLLSERSSICLMINKFKRKNLSKVRSKVCLFERVAMISVKERKIERIKLMSDRSQSV